MTPVLVPITVVIPTYNRPKVLEDTVRCYLSGKTRPSQILIVDQSPEPFDPGRIADRHGVKLDVLRSRAPSLPLARNVGVQAASNDIILFSDDDIIVNKDSVTVLARKMADPSQALVAGVTISENGVHGNLKAPGLANNIIGTLLGLKKPWRKDGYVVKLTMRGRYPMPVFESAPTEWAMGYFFCIRRSLMERFDVWFDESLKRYAYAEDLDFSMRYCVAAGREGLACTLEPDIYVEHLASTEWRTPSEEAVRYFIDNRRHIVRKVYPNQGWRIPVMTAMDALFALSQMPRDTAYAKLLMRTLFSRKESANKPREGS